MNEAFVQLKQEYDEIGFLLTALFKEQQNVRDMMAGVCEHIEVYKVEADSFNEEETQIYKCSTCFSYLSEQQIKLSGSQIK